ncbi:MAG: hypothetical protein K2Q25_09170 [Mycobacteriaceae bacterium]|nr:hypothetical protein [Mycobacteriaceae bacterium]
MFASSLGLFTDIAVVAELGFFAAVAGSMHYFPIPDEQDTKALQAALAYLYVALGLIEALEALNGWDSPDDGKVFHDRAAQFSPGICGILTDAVATKWSSNGAQAYNQANTDQQTHVQKIADADAKIADILATQADQVRQGRRELADTKLAFLGA